MEPHPDSFKDGWMLTGDLGYFDADGYLWLVGRSKDIINRGGEKVSPTKVEGIIEQLNYVQNVAVVPVADDIYGEAVAAVVIDGSKDKQLHHQRRAEIMALTSEHLANFERPTQVYFVDSFPLNPTNKIMRPQLTKIVEAMTED
ncbi:AMP-binding enzyme [Lacticaseibacillus sharpeae]